MCYYYLLANSVSVPKTFESMMSIIEACTNSASAGVGECVYSRAFLWDITYVELNWSCPQKRLTS